MGNNGGAGNDGELGYSAEARPLFANAKLGFGAISHFAVKPWR